MCEKVVEKAGTVFRMRKNTIRQILVNLTCGWIAILVRALIAMVMVPFLLGKLGKDGYGLVSLMGVIVGLTAVADLGLRGALGRELSEQVAKKDQQAFNELVSTALVLYLSIGLGLALVAWMLAPWFATVFKVPDVLRLDAIRMVRFYGSLSVIISFVAPVFSASLSSYHRFDLINVVQIFGGIVSSLLLFVVISFVDNALWGWVAVMLVFQLTILLLKIFFFKKFCVGGRIGFGCVNFSRLRPLFQLGGYMYALRLTQTLSARSDPLVISFFFGAAGVALYQPAGKLSDMVRPVVTMLAEQLYPLTTRQHVGNDQEKMQKILLLGTKFTLLLGVLVSVCMFVFAEPFCRLWLEKSIGSDYTVVAKIMMGWAIIDFTTYAAGTQWPVLLGMKKLKFLVWTQLPTAVLNVLISIYLVGYTNLGIPGVVVATIVIGCVRRPILMWHTARECGLSFFTYFRLAYARPLVALIPPLVAAIYIKQFSSGWLSLILCLCFTGLVWLAASLVLCLGKAEYQLIRKFIMNRVSA